jgi:hypothetical protein
MRALLKCPPDEARKFPPGEERKLGALERAGAEPKFDPPFPLFPPFPWRLPAWAGIDRTALAIRARKRSLKVFIVLRPFD